MVNDDAHDPMHIHDDETLKAYELAEKLGVTDRAVSKWETGSGYPDIALLPIGDKFTMGPFEAALGTMWMNPKVVIPMHYNTFPAIAQDPVVFSNFVKQLSSDSAPLRQQFQRIKTFYK